MGQVAFSPHAASPTGPFRLIWKAEWWVSMSVRRWSERSCLSGCQRAAGASMLRERPSLASWKRIGFIKTSEDWVTSMVQLINHEANCGDVINVPYHNSRVKGGSLKIKGMQAMWNGVFTKQHCSEEAGCVLFYSKSNWIFLVSTASSGVFSRTFPFSTTKMNPIALMQ